MDENGADIFIFRLNANYIIQGLSELTRFRKSKIEEINLSDVREKIDNFDEFLITVSSTRIDNIISELIASSRTKAVELVEDEKVLVNYEVVSKNSKMVNFGDIITVRGKGKFIIDDLVRNTRNDRKVIKVRKYA